ncbi:MAG TPA: CPBP family intramembrane glutamic endopeptidase [Pseudobacter sp.]|nr:CPBP family intramembrane glutamic endopeptidase [Pseudobacter sp.]
MKERLPAIGSPWTRVLLFLIAYIVCVVAMSVVVLTLILSGSLKLTLNTNTMLALISLSSVVSIALVVIFRRYIDKRSISSLGLLPFSKDGYTGLLLAMALLGCGTLLLYFNGNLHWLDYSFDTGAFFLSFLVLGLAVFAEELVFRGYILGNLMESGNRWYALLVSAVLFALAHISNTSINGVAMVNLVLAGVLLGLNYIYTKNLWFGILFHFGWNFFQGPVLGYEVSGLGLPGILELEMSGNPLLTGSTFGFEGSLIATMLLLTAILLLYLAFEKRKAGEV